MKSKTLEMSDYPEIREEVRSLLRAEAEYRGAGYTFELAHISRQWEYGSALSALREAGIAPPARVLDVGCGHGPLGPWLAKLHYKVDEIDPSPNTATRGELRPAMTNLDWAFAGIPLLDFKPSAPYAAVLSISVMEHIPEEEQEASWEKLTTLLEPEGLLFVTVDFGRPDAANHNEREMIYDEALMEARIEQLQKLGIVFEEIDLSYKGDQVYNYTFFRLVGRKAR